LLEFKEMGIWIFTFLPSKRFVPNFGYDVRAKTTARCKSGLLQRRWLKEFAFDGGLFLGGWSVCGGKALTGRPLHGQQG
jgi:hypothetical protein